MLINDFLSADALKKLAIWEKAQDDIVLVKQKESVANGKITDKFLIDQTERGIPYYGATGGSLTYMITPCSLGMAIVIKHNVTKAEIDLTDYDSL